MEFAFGASGFHLGPLAGSYFAGPNNTTYLNGVVALPIPLQSLTPSVNNVITPRVALTEIAASTGAAM